jgi:hypothetical protein
MIVADIRVGTSTRCDASTARVRGLPNPPLRSTGVAGSQLSKQPVLRLGRPEKRKTADLIPLSTGSSGLFCRPIRTSRIKQMVP